LTCFQNVIWNAGILLVFIFYTMKPTNSACVGFIVILKPKGDELL